MDLLHKYLIQEGVGTSVYVSSSNIENEGNGDVVIMNDARSAAFYAMGASIKSCTPVALFVPGMYLTNVLTAITEAWFQKVNLIVVATFNCIDEMKTSWMDRCIVDSLSCDDSEMEKYEERIKSMCHAKGPVLINILNKNDRNKKKMIDYTAVFKQLDKEMLTPRVLNCYKPANDKTEFGFEIKAIMEEHAYGVISKYVGGSAVADIGYLICPIECALIDINIFRTRYANSNMKIILIDLKKEAKEQGIDQWIESCKWQCFRYMEHDMTIISEFCNSECASVLLWEVE